MLSPGLFTAVTAVLQIGRGLDIPIRQGSLTRVTDAGAETERGVDTTASCCHSKSHS